MNKQQSLREKITSVATEAIAEKVFPGCVIGVMTRGEDCLLLPFGNFTYERDSPVVQVDTVYDVASVTKSIPTASLALYLIDQGKISLDDALIKYVPEYQGSYRDEVTIYHLLTHTLQFSFTMASVASLGRDEILSRIFHATLLSAPGSTYHYANATSILLGMVIEQVMEVPLAMAAGDIFFGPLGMTKTTFTPRSDVPPTEIVGGKSIQGIVHDESTRALLPQHVGAAGLFSSARDLSHFLQMLLDNGTYHGKRFLSSRIIKSIYTDEVSMHHFGLGWEIGAPWMGENRVGIFGKTGFTGSMIACDIEKQVGIVLLSNRTYPKRPLTGDEINGQRKKIVDIVFASLKP